MTAKKKTTTEKKPAESHMGLTSEDEFALPDVIKDWPVGVRVAAGVGVLIVVVVVLGWLL